LGLKGQVEVLYQLSNQARHCLIEPAQRNEGESWDQRHNNSLRGTHEVVEGVNKMSKMRPGFQKPNQFLPVLLLLLRWGDGLFFLQNATRGDCLAPGLLICQRTDTKCYLEITGLQRNLLSAKCGEFALYSLLSFWLLPFSLHLSKSALLWDCTFCCWLLCSRPY
jgi:hypothetical protein